jgi:LEA14-like dessication related protein
VRVLAADWRWLVVASLLAWISGCTSLMAERDPPVVSVENVQALQGQGGGPRFDVTLRVTNPNKDALDIAGISYSVFILDRELVTGVTNEVPRIEGYSEQTVSLEAGVNLLQLLRLLADLGRQRTEALDYRFAAKIDFTGLLPTQRVEETGTLRLN